MNETIIIRIDKETKKQLTIKAKKLGLKLSAYCRMILTIDASEGSHDGK